MDVTMDIILSAYLLCLSFTMPMGVSAQLRLLPCDITPSSGCECWDPDRPQVVCASTGLTTLPSFQEDMSSVHTLHIVGNNITSLHENAFVGLSSLQRLLLEDNMIAIVDSGAFNGLVSTLKFLSLAHNELHVIPAELNNLTSLEVLHLEYNNINSIPSDCLQLQNVAQLFLDHNPITYIGVWSLKPMPSLKALSLTVKYTWFSNPFYVATSVLPIEALMYYSSYGLKFQMSETFFKGLTYLTQLTLKDCGLGDDTGWLDFPTDILSNSVEILDLSNNNLVLEKDTTVWNILQEFTFLKVLDLSGNSIRIIGVDTIEIFDAMNDLEELNLMGNDLELFAPEVMLSIGHLNVLDLSYNSLEHLDFSSMYLYFMDDFQLYLSGNPWVCDQQLCWLKWFAVGQMAGEGYHLATEELHYTLRCSEPDQLSQLLIVDTPTWSCQAPA